MLGFFLFVDGCIELRLEGLKFLLMTRTGGLDEEEQELRAISGVLALQLQQGFVIEDGKLDLLLESHCLLLQLLFLQRLVLRLNVGVQYPGVFLVVAHELCVGRQRAAGARLLIDLIMAMIILIKSINSVMSCTTEYCPQFFFGYIGVASALIFANLGAAYGSAKAGVGICSMGVLKPELIMKSVVPVVMAGILGIYGMIVAVIIVQRITPDYPDKTAYAHLASGLCCGFSSLAAGLAIGIVGDAGVRANAQQDKIFVGMILILIFGEALALYGLIVSLILTSQ